MLEALLGGHTDPKLLADLALGRLRSKRAELEQALVGVFKPHHRFLLTELLAQIDTLDEAINRVSEQSVLHMQTPEPAEPTPVDEHQPPAPSRSGLQVRHGDRETRLGCASSALSLGWTVGNYSAASAHTLRH